MTFQSSGGSQGALKCSQLGAKTIPWTITAQQESNALQTEDREATEVPPLCTHHQLLLAATASPSLRLSLADSYPHWWLWLYSAGSCSTSGSLAGLSITSTVPSLRYGLPGKSPFTSECVAGGGMPVGSTVRGSGSVTSSSIRLLDEAAPPAAAAADCLSTHEWARLPPQFGFVPEQRHRFPEPRCLIFEQWEQQVRQLLSCSTPWLLTHSLPPSLSESPSLPPLLSHSLSSANIPPHGETEWRTH